jgi:ferredoxin
MDHRVIEIDTARCAYTGECVTVAPEIFWFEGDELTVRDSIAPEDFEDAQRAIELCPMQALRWIS